MKILVTGGAGYIGSFIVRQLKAEGHEVIIMDDMTSGHQNAIDGFTLHKINIASEKHLVEELFSKYKFDGVIHMASFIQMGESFRNPSKYFHNNLQSALYLLDAMTSHSCKYIVFSSSAGVYGNPSSLPIRESDAKNPLNPYGETKLMIERILHWYEKAHGITSVSIRYFNAAGAALDGSIGEDHPNESHLIPLVIKSAMEKKTMTLFGNDYPTKDGTCVRDYVHVLDLAKAHTAALKYLANGGSSETCNAGAGTGYSNAQIVQTVEKVTGLPVNIEYGPRREGDAAELWASIEKIQQILNWKPEYSLEDIVGSAYLWHSQHPKGY